MTCHRVLVTPHRHVNAIQGFANKHTQVNAVTCSVICYVASPTVLFFCFFYSYTPTHFHSIHHSPFPIVTYQSQLLWRKTTTSLSSLSVLALLAPSVSSSQPLIIGSRRSSNKFSNLVSNKLQASSNKVSGSQLLSSFYSNKLSSCRLSTAM